MHVILRKPLTPRERQVADLIARGMTGREVAMCLGIAYFTVRKHRSNILAKLVLSSAAHLSVHCVRTSLAVGALPDGEGGAALPLSARQWQIAKQVAEGWSSKEIARHLGISPLTVRRHRRNIYALLGVHSVAELAFRVLSAGMTHTPSE